MFYFHRSRTDAGICAGINNINLLVQKESVLSKSRVFGITASICGTKSNLQRIFTKKITFANWDPYKYSHVFFSKIVLQMNLMPRDNEVCVY